MSTTKFYEEVLADRRDLLWGLSIHRAMPLSGQYQEIGSLFPQKVFINKWKAPLCIGHRTIVMVNFMCHLGWAVMARYLGETF